MAGTKYAYIKSFELPDPLLPNTFIVLRVDGCSFHLFTAAHGFAKPVDERGLKLMDHAARDVMQAHRDIVLGFGESDEYSFLLRRSTALYNRRHAKILTSLTSHVTASYIFHWGEYFPDIPLQYPPTFDGRIILLPSISEVRDYFSWRQADTHINNLYNTAFWALVQQGGRTTAQAHEALRGTVSTQKHEILFSQFGINYNALPERFRKGSVLARDEIDAVIASQDSNATASASPNMEIVDKPCLKAKKRKAAIQILHVDIIGNSFWEQRPGILSK